MHTAAGCSDEGSNDPTCSESNREESGNFVRTPVALCIRFSLPGKVSADRPPPMCPHKAHRAGKDAEMNITINGNVTINGSINGNINGNINGIINSANNSNLTINEAKTLAERGKLTLRQLRSILPSTEGVSTPTRDWVRKHLDSDEVFFSRQYPDGCSLTVFRNGFYRYGNEKWTVLRVDGFSRIYYEIDEDGGYDTLEEDAFLDDCFIAALGLNALWQLKRNAEKRDAEHGEVSSEDGSLDGTVDESTGDILEGIIEQEEKAEEHTHLLKAWATLTDQQKAVIWMIKVKGLTQEDVAKRIGVSRPRVAAVLRQTIEKLQKNI